MFYAFYIGNMAKIAKKILLTIITAAILLYVCIWVVLCIYPIRHEALITKYAEKYGLEESFVYAVIHTESKFDTSAKSYRGASGLMQLAKITADWGAEEIGIEGYDYIRVFEPEISIQIGCWYLNKLINQYGSQSVALAAYNAGSGNVSGWLSDKRYSVDGDTLYYIPFDETRDYIKKVEFNRHIYGILFKLFDFVPFLRIS